MLAGDVSNAAASVNAQRAALDQEASGVASQVNALTASIASLNRQIQSTSANSDAGALEDQRQQDLNKLSQLVGINQITTENNGLTITTTSGETLIAEGVATQLTTGTVNGVTHFFVGGTDATTDLTGRRRTTGRISDGARPGHSAGDGCARSTGFRTIGRGECAERQGARPERKCGRGDLCAVPAGGGKRCEHEGGR